MNMEPVITSDILNQADTKKAFFIVAYLNWGH